MVLSCFDTDWKKYYRCDLEGNVYRLAGTYGCKVERKLKTSFDRYGYKKIVLFFNSKPIYTTQHRLVAMYFIHNFENKYTVEHKNHNKGDNRLYNLCWFSQVEQEACRVGNCNEKNIYKRKDGRWQIKINRNKLKYLIFLPKTKTLNDAILQRDKMLSMF